MRTSSNSQFLAVYSPLLADLGATAEGLYPFDSASELLKRLAAQRAAEPKPKRGRKTLGSD